MNDRKCVLAQRAAIALAGVALAGCSSLSGIGGSSQYSCKAPTGVHCESVSGVYANAVQSNLPRQQTGRRAATSVPAATSPAAAPAAGLQRVAAPTAFTPTALRSDARVVRMWVKAWEDQDHDLVDQSYVYVQVDNGRWLVDHAQSRTRSAYAALRSPNEVTGPVQKPAPAPSPEPVQPPNTVDPAMTEPVASAPPVPQSN